MLDSGSPLLTLSLDETARSATTPGRIPTLFPIEADAPLLSTAALTLPLHRKACLGLPVTFKSQLTIRAPFLEKRVCLRRSR